MIEELKRWGCDTDDAMGRMLDDEDFYRECLMDIPADPYFARLGEALKAHDIQTAFDAAHTLKGVLANLGLTPMYNTAVEIVEPLRAGRDEGLLPKFAELMKEKDRLENILQTTQM